VQKGYFRRRDMVGLNRSGGISAKRMKHRDAIEN